MPYSREGYDILIVEDNDDDFEATSRALNGGKHKILRCRDALEAWEFLKGDGQRRALDNDQLPGLILLDLNMPGLDGRKFLQRMKNDALLRAIPVVIMTTSNDSLDVQSCYEAGANTYVCKPVRWKDFNEAVGRIRDYWLKLAVLPGLERDE
jgi:two-component system response regulator